MTVQCNLNLEINPAGYSRATGIDQKGLRVSQALCDLLLPLITRLKTLDIEPHIEPGSAIMHGESFREVCVFAGMAQEKGGG
jgi:hypothetical protein